MSIRIYVRASTKDQDAERSLDDLKNFASKLSNDVVEYIENASGTKLNRPVLNKLLEDSVSGDILLIESVDRLSRLTQDNFEILKDRIKSKGLKLVVADLPTTHIILESSNEITASILKLINNMLIDILATMARLDNEKRKERIKQGLLRSNYISTGRKPNEALHKRAIELRQLGLSIEEICRALKCGEATVYRAIKADKTLKASKST